MRACTSFLMYLLCVFESRDPRSKSVFVCMSSRSSACLEKLGNWLEPLDALSETYDDDEKEEQEEDPPPTMLVLVISSTFKSVLVLLWDCMMTARRIFDALGSNEHEVDDEGAISKFTNDTETRT